MGDSDVAPAPESLRGRRRTLETQSSLIDKCMHLGLNKSVNISHTTDYKTPRIDKCGCTWQSIIYKKKLLTIKQNNIIVRLGCRGSTYSQPVGSQLSNLALRAPYRNH